VSTQERKNESLLEREGERKGGKQYLQAYPCTKRSEMGGVPISSSSPPEIFDVMKEQIWRFFDSQAAGTSESTLLWYKLCHVAIFEKSTVNIN